MIRVSSLNVHDVTRVQVQRDKLVSDIGPFDVIHIILTGDYESETIRIEVFPKGRCPVEIEG